MNSAWHREIHQLRQRDQDKNGASWVGRAGKAVFLFTELAS